VRVSQAANRYIGIEELTEEELVDFRQRCQERANAAVPRAQDKADEAEARIESAVDTALANLPQISGQAVVNRRCSNGRMGFADADLRQPQTRA
jgi:low affinity Fe/Cu permease